MKQRLERIFTPLNIDDNGRLISKLLQPIKLQIFRDLAENRPEEALTLYIHLLTTMSRAYVADRHFLYVDSRYLPDRDCTDIYRWMQNSLENQAFPAVSWQRLQETLQALKQHKAYWEYQIPTICNMNI